MGNISWSYLDKRSAAIAALKDYSSMQFIINHTDEDILDIRQEMTGVGSPAPDGMPHAHDPQSGEERVVDALDEIDVLKERYRQALEYMDWFKPAWDFLSEDERFVLESFYTDENYYGANAAFYVAAHFKVEQASAYRKKNRALEHLTVLLFGKA